MSRSAFNPGRLTSLLNGYCNGELDEPQREAMLQTLRDSDQARRLYIHYMELHTTLSWRGAGEAVTTSAQPNDMDMAFDVCDAQLLAEVMDQQQEAASRLAQEQALSKQQSDLEQAQREKHLEMLFGLKRQPVQPVKRIVIPKAVFYGGVATLAAVLLLMVLPIFETQSVVPAPMNEPAPAPAPQFVQVAVLVEQVDAHWLVPGSNRPAPGDALLNQPMHLTAGLAKVRFNNEAEVILEAPCSIEPISAGEIKITHGKLVGRCGTVASKGFVVQTPGAAIVDRGTEFGVSVDKQGVAQAHVFEGEIKLAAATSDQPVYLLQGQARRVDAEGTRVSTIKTDELAFVRGTEFDANAKADQSPYHRWLAHRYEMRRSSRPPIAMIDIDAAQLHQTRLFRNTIANSNVTDAMTEDAWMVRDRFGRPRGASYINDLKTSPRLHVGGEFRELTLACWVRFDATVQSQIFRVLLNSNGVDQRGQVHWQIQKNQNIQLGVYLDDEKDATFENLNSEDLGDLIQDDAWHLLTTVCDLNQGFVQHYLDGRPYGWRKVQFVGSLVIGDCHLGNWNYGDYKALDKNRELRGALDDLLIWDHALPQHEIQTLYVKSKPK